MISIVIFSFLFSFSTLKFIYFFKLKSNNVDEIILPMSFSEKPVIVSLYICKACAGVAFSLGISLKYSPLYVDLYFLFSFTSFDNFIAFFMLYVPNATLTKVTTNVIIKFWLSLCLLFAFASSTHFVSSFITAPKISLLYNLFASFINSVGNNVLISTYFPLIKLFISNSILSESVA